MVIGISQLALGGWMAVAPSSFFQALGGFGAENSHYLRDVRGLPRVPAGS